MSQTITIQIPDDLAQDLASQAEQLNVSVENLVVRSLSTLAHTADGEERSDTSSNDTNSDIGEAIAHLLSTLHNAKNTGQNTLQTPLLPATIHLASLLKKYGLIADVQFTPGYPPTHLTLSVAPSSTLDPLPLPELKEQDISLAPKQTEILQAINHEDPQIRMQAIAALGELYGE